MNCPYCDSEMPVDSDTNEGECASCGAHVEFLNERGSKWHDIEKTVKYYERPDDLDGYDHEEG